MSIIIYSGDGNWRKIKNLKHATNEKITEIYIGWDPRTKDEYLKYITRVDGNDSERSFRVVRFVAFDGSVSEKTLLLKSNKRETKIYDEHFPAKDNIMFSRGFLNRGFSYGMNKAKKGA